MNTNLPLNNDYFSRLEEKFAPQIGYLDKLKTTFMESIGQGEKILQNAGQGLRELSNEVVSGNYRNFGPVKYASRALNALAPQTPEEGLRQGLVQLPGGKYFDPTAFGGLKDVSKIAKPKIFKGLKSLSTKLLEKFRGMPENITEQEFKTVLNKVEKEGIRKADLDVVKEMAKRQQQNVTGIIKKDIPINEIRANFKINRELDVDKIDSIVEKFKKTGKIEPIVVDLINGKTIVIDGHHRLIAMKRLGFETVPVFEYQGDLTKLTLIQRERIRDEYLKNLKKNGKINLSKLASDVETQLVPLIPTPVKSPRWSNVGADFIGDGKYGEIVYQSPIKTSAGDVHFRVGTRLGSKIKGVQDFPNYFSHIRYEDMADGKTRKILETQSDLTQKENFEKELDSFVSFDKNVTSAERGRITRLQNQNKYKEAGKLIDEIMARGKKIVESRQQEFSKLQPYSSNDPLAQLRTFREEVKRAAKDGKDTLLIPSGETAMKIEGLGDNTIWSLDNATDAVPSKLKVGKEIYRGERAIGTNENDAWIITDVLGDGKFKAVPKQQYDEIIKAQKTYGDAQTRFVGSIEERLAGRAETFDISGKVDTQHFVYKLNEEAIPREARKMGLEVLGKIKEGLGDWWKIKIPKERSRMPIEAFGVIPFLNNEEE